MLDGVDCVVTMRCGVEGVSPATFVAAEDQELEGSSGKPMEKVREVRDQLAKKVMMLPGELLQE